MAGTPDTNQEVHGDERHLVEHEHREQVGRDEEAEDTRREQREPKEILLGERFELPRGKGAGEHDDARQQEHDDGDAVDAHAVGNVQGLEPRRTIGEQHLGGIAGTALLDKVNRQPDGKDQQARSTCHHHATHLIDVLGQPEAKQHQHRDYYE